MEVVDLHTSHEVGHSEGRGSPLGEEVEEVVEEDQEEGQWRWRMRMVGEAVADGGVVVQECAWEQHGECGEEDSEGEEASLNSHSQTF